MTTNSGEHMWKRETLVRNLNEHNHDLKKHRKVQKNVRLNYNISQRKSNQYAKGAPEQAYAHCRTIHDSKKMLSAWVSTN